MAWSTIYITGRENFQNEIISKLRNTWIQGSPEVKDDLIMFWLPDTVNLRSLKSAIGSVLIFKHRLQFITDLNEHLEPEFDESAKFSDVEKEMILKMQKLDGHRDQTNSGTTALISSIQPDN